MNKGLLSKILPHFLAVLTFLIVSVAFNMSALEGNTLGQHDTIGWKGMAQQGFDYKAAHGHFPLWNTNAFSGMPNYLTVMNGKSVLPDLHRIFGLWLPEPVNFFFIACVCFYILCMALRLRPLIGILGALAFGFATYNPIIISAGHLTKISAIAYMPLLLAGIILTYEKKYWLGIAVTTLGAYMQITSNHPQISYYFFIVAFCITIPYLIAWIRKKEWKHIGIALGITAVSALVGIGSYAVILLTTAEYTKATMRGGKTVNIAGDKVEAVKTTGLDTSYAFSYSLGTGEVVTLIMPNAYGGSSKLPPGEKSAVVTKLTARGIPETEAARVAANLPRFWGESDSTAGGPLYSGAIICILALIGFVTYKKRLRWGLLAASVLGIMMAWGRHFEGFNLFLFENLPLYNKFRAPSITMVILQLTIPIAAVLGLQYILYRENSRELLRADFKKILYAMGGLIALLGIMYLANDYSASFDAQIIANYTQGGSDEFGRLIVAGLKEDRKSLFGLQLLRTIGYIILVVGLLWLYLKNMMKPVIIVILLALINIIDLVIVDKDYLNEESYYPKDDMAVQVTNKNPIDIEILKDTAAHYRVYNLSQDRFSASDYHYSVFHKAIGGYHAAKLRLYQDIMERYLYGGYNAQILNMLNVKYIIAENPQNNGQPTLSVNAEAYGPCWLVKHVKFAKDDAEALQALGMTNLRDTAVVLESSASQVKQPAPDSASSITLSKFDNDAIEYTADCKSQQFAVFSEVYYPYGWNAYIDGQKADYVRADYVLRGISIPAGKHTIRFVFEPASFRNGVNTAYISSFLVVILVLGGFFMNWWQGRRK